MICSSSQSYHSVWCVWNWLFHSHPLWFIEILEDSFDVFSSFIRSYWLYFLTETVLNHSLLIFKSLKKIRFLFHEVDPAIPGTIINKGEEIPATIDGVCGHSSSYITMYQIKYRGSSMCLPNIIPLLWMLTYQETSTYSIGGLDGEKTFNHFIIVELLQIFEIEMAKYLMMNIYGVCYS